jgi:hypothetical protein
MNPKSVRRLSLSLALCAAVVLLPAAAHALPVLIGEFPSGFDPNPPEYTVQPVDPSGPRPGLSENITGPPVLAFGQTSQAGPTQPGDLHEPTENNMQMTWDPVDPNLDARAGWELEFGLDPDLRNAWMALSVLPPGWINPQTGLFVGVSSISVVALDGAGIIAGGWGFNTDQLGLAGPVVNDPAAAGLISLYNNAMHNVLINVRNGPAAGSAVVTSIGPPLGPPVIGPNFLIGGNNNFANIQWLQYYENGILRGQTGIPGTGQTGMVNWWDHLKIFPTPEPTTMVLLGGGLLVLARKRRKKK